MLPNAKLTGLLALTVVVLYTLGIAGREPRDLVSESPSGLCSIIPWPMWRDPDATYFVALALGDTARARIGEVQPSVEGPEGHPEAVYGQVVLVADVGGSGLDRLELAFRRASSREVVAVPWSHDTACEPAYWAQSARWVGVGKDGFYSARLRPDSLWAEGRPTLDVFFAGSVHPLCKYTQSPALCEQASSRTPLAVV